MDKTTCDICGEVKECEIQHYDIAPDTEYDNDEQVAYTTTDLIEGQGYEMAICQDCLNKEDLKELIVDRLTEFK